MSAFKLLTTFFSVLQYRGFRNIWISQCCGQVATNLLHFSLVLLTYERTGSSFFVGLLIALISLPPILFSTLGGMVADRYDRRHILFLINGSRVIIALALLLFDAPPSVALSAVFILTTLSEFFIPTESASIPSLVPPTALISANSLSAFTLYASFLVGYTSAGPMLHWGGARMTFAIIAGLYTIAGIATFGLPSLTGHLSSSTALLKESSTHWRAQFLAGLHFIRSHHLLGLVTGAVALLFGIERGVISLIPELARYAYMHTPAAISALLIVPLAFGTVVGAFVVHRFKQRISPVSLIHAGIASEAFALLLFAPFSSLFLFLFPSFAAIPLVQGFAAVAACIAGAGNVMIMVSMQTYIQRETADAQRGRVFGSFLMIVNGVGLPVLLLVSHIGSFIPAPFFLTALSMIIIFFTGISFLSIKIHLRRHIHLPTQLT